MGRKRRQEFHQAFMDKTKDQEGERSCFHINKSVVLARLKPKRNIKLQQKRLVVPDSPVAEDKEKFWICLKCGQLDCGHTQHTDNRLSNLHCLSFNVISEETWCNVCKISVEAKDHQKLNKAIQLLQQHFEDTYEVYENVKVENEVEHKPEEQEQEGELKTLTDGYPPRGLKNLGNTCYFNVVLQCLARTPTFLSEMEKLKEQTVVVIDENLFKDDSCENLNTITLKIDKWMNFSELLLKALEELNMPERKPYVPIKLLYELHRLSSIITKDEQHDAHELLREIFQKMKEMDNERFKSAVFKNLKSPRSSDKGKMDDRIHQIIQSYENYASNKFFLENIFGGTLVSILKCQECGKTSYSNEPFLDLSLPIADKTMTSFEINVKNSNPHLIKIDESKQEQRNLNLENTTDDTKEDSLKIDGSEHSDADVEDNIEQDVGSSWIGESGHGSEKHDISLDSALSNQSKGEVFSPISPVVNGDKLLTEISHAETLPFSSSDKSQDIVGTAERGVSKDTVCDEPNTNKDLMVVTTTSISSLYLESTGSPLSDRDTPSPVSSEINIDCSTSIRMHADCSSPISPECNGYRPVSRFAFCDDVDNAVRCSPVSEINSISSKTVVSELDSKCSEQLDTPSVNLDNNSTSFTDPCSQPDQLFNKCSAMESSVSDIANEHMNQTEAIENLKKLSLRDGDNSAFIVLQNHTGTKDKHRTVNGNNRKSDCIANAVMDKRVESDASRFTLECCLNNFTALEFMRDNERVACSNCTEKNDKGETVLTNSTKQIWICSPPTVLILHIKRFEVKADSKSKGRRSARPRKLNRHIQFPIVLDVAPYIYHKNKEQLNLKPGQAEMYSLYAVIEHKGSISQGHYIVYIKNKAAKGDGPKLKDVNGNNCRKDKAMSLPAKWFIISDDTVQKVEEKDVLKSQAYILFYEKCR